MCHTPVGILAKGKIFWAPTTYRRPISLKPEPPATTPAIRFDQPH